MCVGQDSDGVNGIVKYLLFFFNFIFWLIGCALIGLGAWAYIEKNRFYHNDIQSIYDILFDVSIGVIVVGCIIFVIAFAGCLGALRENITLLKTFSYMLGILFLLEVVGAILIFVFSGQGKEEVTKLFREEGIIRYRDDPDFQGIFDWVQETFYCCGVGHKGYKEWSMNVYFNCSDTNPSAERCAVPFSCCKQPNDVSSGQKNLMCGYGVQKLEYLEATEKVYIKGCVQAVIDEAKQNLYILGAAALALAVPQILGPILACWFAFNIEDRHDDIRRMRLIKQTQNLGHTKKGNSLRSAQNWDVRPKRPNSLPSESNVVKIDYGYDLYLNPNKKKSTAKHKTKRHPSQPPNLTKAVIPKKTKFMPEKEDLHTELIHEPKKKHLNPLDLPPVIHAELMPIMKHPEHHESEKKHFNPLDLPPVLHSELIPIMKHREPKKKHPLALPPIERLASHCNRNWGGTRLDRSTGKVHKRKAKIRILNPLNLPPVARAAGTDVVMGILARRERMRRMHRGVSYVLDDHQDQHTLEDDHQQLEHNPPTPRISRVEDIATIEKPPRKNRIYPQRQLRDLCSASDIVNLNMSVLSSPTVQATPKSNDLEAHRQTYPHLAHPLPTEERRHNVAFAEVHSSSDPIDGPRPGPSMTAGQQEEPTSFAQMQKMLGELLNPRKQQTGQLYWELPAATGNETEEPLLIPRPDYNAAEPPVGNRNPHMASYVPQLPVQQPQQQHAPQPFINQGYPQYQPVPTVSMVPSIAHPGSMLRSVQYAPPVFAQPMSARVPQPVRAHTVLGTSYVRYPQEFIRPRRPFHNVANQGHSRMPLHTSEGLTRIYYN